MVVALAIVAAAGLDDAGYIVRKVNGYMLTDMNKEKVVPN